VTRGADLRGVDLVREWQAAMQSVAASVTGATGRSDVARQLLAPLQRQAELVQEVLERERELQRDLLGRVFEPFDAAFDLLEQSGAALREQAEAIEHAARSLEQAAGLMKAQADLFERTIRTLREPSRRIESAVGLDPTRTGSSSSATVRKPRKRPVTRPVP
jgi:signal transduction histidine kinase